MEVPVCAASSMWHPFGGFNSCPTYADTFGGRGIFVEIRMRGVGRKDAVWLRVVAGRRFAEIRLKATATARIRRGVARCLGALAQPNDRLQVERLGEQIE